MKIKNIETVKAVAQRIGKSKKESVIIDGEVFIKSCAIGLWNYLTVCEANNFSYPSGEVDGRKTYVEAKHRDEWKASLYVKSAKADSASYSKESGRDSQAKFRVIKIERGE